MMDDILVPTSPGELVDKLTILQIKSERVTDAAKLQNIHHEQTRLDQIARRHLKVEPKLQVMWDQLYRINCTLWQIEDGIRECEASSNFGPEFIHLARAVYRTNDQRADVKKQINQWLGSALIEEKSYADYGASE